MAGFVQPDQHVRTAGLVELSKNQELEFRYARVNAAIVDPVLPLHPPVTSTGAMLKRAGFDPTMEKPNFSLEVPFLYRNAEGCRRSRP